MLKEHPEKQYKILLVDDEHIVLESLSELLGDIHEVVTATNAADALTLASRELFHIIIADYKMPGMNGIALLMHFKITQPDAVRILLTGFPTVQAIQEAINKASIFRFISKPWNNRDLLETIDEALELHYAAELKRRLSEQLLREYLKTERLLKITRQTAGRADKDGAASLIEDVWFYNQANFKIH